jgi:CBS domain-containing protein
MNTTVATLVAADAMVHAPKVHGPALTIGEVRTAFADGHVHMLLLVDEGRLLGTVVRGDVPQDAVASGPVLPFASTIGRTVGPAAPVAEVQVAMLTDGVRRLAVVGEGDALLGLLCLKSSLVGFCSDADVAARVADRRGCP